MPAYNMYDCDYYLPLSLTIVLSDPLEFKEMATMSASNFAAVLPMATLKGSSKAQSPPALGLPVMATNGRVRCSLEQKPCGSCHPSMAATLMAAAAAAAMTATAAPAMALVDERLSGEGTGLPFGLSNNLLGWIPFGVFGLIWALYFICLSSLEQWWSQRFYSPEA